MPIIIDEKKLIIEIKQLLKEITNKIEVEKMIDNAYEEAMKDIPHDVVDTPAYCQLWMSVYPIDKQLKDLEKKPDIEELILIKRQLKDINKEIDVTGQKYNWGNARKYKTPNNSKLLKEITRIKSKSFINKSNQLSENISLPNQDSSKQNIL